jgi:transposase
MSQSTKQYSAEVRERAVRLVLEHQGEYRSRWKATESIASKIGCSAYTLHEWIKRAQDRGGQPNGSSIEMAERLKRLERENRELKQANEILRKASAYFAQAELDRRPKS